MLAAIVAVPSRAALINEILIAGLFALSLDLILGLTGIVSLGQAAFFGLGAYAAAILASNGFADPTLGLLVGAAVAAVLGFVTAPLLLRGVGSHPAHGDARRLADARRTRQPQRLADRRRGRAQLLDGKGARPLPDRLHRTAQRGALQSRRPFRPVRRRAAARAIAVRAGARRRSAKTGCAPARSASPPAAASIAIYTVSAAYAGAAGALLAQTTQIVSLDLFDFHRSADVMLMLIIGGAGYLYGGIIGAAVFIVLRDVISAATPEYWEFWIGALLVALVLIGRERIQDLVVQAASFFAPKAGARRRGVSAPALEARGLVKQFGALLATDNVSFAIAAGRASGADRPQRRRQDDADQSADRRRQADRGPGPPRRARRDGARAAASACGSAFRARSRSTSSFPI